MQKTSFAFKETWATVSKFGIGEGTSEVEAVKVRLLNQLAFISLLVALFFLSVSILVSAPIMIVYIIVIPIALLVLLAQYAGYWKLARSITCWGFPSIICWLTVVQGLAVGQAYLYILCGILAFILYENHQLLKFCAVFFVIIIGVGSSFYLINNIPPDQLVTNAYDKLISFIFCVMIGCLIVYLYQQEIKRFEESRQRLIDKLEFKNKELDALNRELDLFTCVASHDLKAPLRNVISFADLIERKLKTNDQVAVTEYLGFIRMYAKQMRSLIEDVLDIAKIDNGNDKKKMLDLNVMMEKTKYTLRQEIEDRNAQVHFDDLPHYFGNEVRLSLLFQNLVQNGIKYNKSEMPTVQVTAYKENDFLIVHFLDNGIGIAPEFHRKIFKLFKRLHGTTEYQGTGVGLGICQKIVCKMGGEIFVESEIGQGSKFVVQLPFSTLPVK